MSNRFLSGVIIYLLADLYVVVQFTQDGIGITAGVLHGISIVLHSLLLCLTQEMKKLNNTLH